MSRLILNEKTLALPRQPKQTLPLDIKKPNQLGYDFSALQIVRACDTEGRSDMILYCIQNLIHFGSRATYYTCILNVEKGTPL
jgi:DUF1365 family protein